MNYSYKLAVTIHDPFPLVVLMMVHKMVPPFRLMIQIEEKE